MYVFCFMYPSQEGDAFDYEHFVNVHMPMGIYLTQKYLGIKPVKVICYDCTKSNEAADTPQRYAAISQVYFETKAAVEHFGTLFNFEEAATRLSEDWKNYTPHPPEVLVAEVKELPSMDALIEQYALTNPA